MSAVLARYNAQREHAEVLLGRGLPLPLVEIRPDAPTLVTLPDHLEPKPILGARWLRREVEGRPGTYAGPLPSPQSRADFVHGVPRRLVIEAGGFDLDLSAEVCTPRCLLPPLGVTECACACRGLWHGARAPVLASARFRITFDDRTPLYNPVRALAEHYLGVYTLPSPLDDVL